MLGLKSKHKLIFLLFLILLVFLIVILIYGKNPVIQTKTISNEVLKDSGMNNLKELTNNSKSEIVIVGAEHLNKKKEIVADIYDYVNETDDITYTIPKNEYLRAYFEEDLIKGNVIDIYVKNTEPATINVYEKDSDVVIGSVGVNGGGVYYIPLDFQGSNYIFDLESIGNGVVYDYVHDGKPYPYTWTAGPNDNGPVNQLDPIDFTGTGTATGGGYTYQMFICKTSTFDKINLCGGGEWCHSSSGLGSGVQASCQYTTTGSDSGQLAYYGWILNSNGDITEASGDPHYFTVNVPDNDPPYFTTIPANANLGLGESLGVDFNATDAVAFDSYAINWTTTFQINQSGWLKNISALSEGVFNINVTINDTVNNLNSTIYVVTVTADTCTCPGLNNNWEINMADSCVISSTCDLGTGNITFTDDVGNVTFNAAINTSNLEYPKTDQTIFLGSNAVITIG